MRIYHAFLGNELIFFKRQWFYLPLFAFISFGLVLAPYFNRFNLSGIHYSANTASFLAFIGAVAGPALISGIFALSSSFAEKNDKLDFFLFSRNISKLDYLLAKLTLPVIISLVFSAVDSSIYYFCGFYGVIAPVPAIICLSILFSVDWVLLSSVLSRLLSRAQDVALSVMAGFVLILTVVFLIAPPENILLTLIAAVVSSLLFFEGTYLFLTGKERDL